MPSATSDRENIKLCDWVLLCDCRQYEVCHLPVLMKKTLSCMPEFFLLHQTVCGVPPASSVGEDDNDGD